MTYIKGIVLVWLALAGFAWFMLQIADQVAELGLDGPLDVTFVHFLSSIPHSIPQEL